MLRTKSSACAGFSMVEAMVGLLIGMIGAVVMMQVFALSEGQKRSVTGGGDAQTNGALGVQFLQRDIRQSGHNISAVELLGCNVVLNPGAAGAVTLNALAPVTINHASIPAGDPNTDTVLVVYGNSNLPVGDIIRLAPNVSPNYAVSTLNLFAVNDRVIAAPRIRPNPCNLQLDTVVAIVPWVFGRPMLTMPAQTDVSVGAGAWQPGRGDGRLFNLGRAPVVRAYAVRGGNLTACDYIANDCGAAGNTGNATIWVPVAGGIASLRAQYGHDTLTPIPPPPPPAGETAQTSYWVDTYDQATPATACGWARLMAVRVALVARSGQFEKTESVNGADVYATSAAPAWSGSANNPIDLSRNPDGSANPYWRNYRYKVFETVVPLRNVTWMGVQSGC